MLHNIILNEQNQEENMRNYLLELMYCNKSYVPIRIRRSPTRHDNIDFRPIITRTSDILPLSVVTADKGYDSEDDHRLVREGLHAFSVIQIDMNMYRYGEPMVISESR